MDALVEQQPAAADSIRLLAIDLDGTLLNDSKQVSDQTASALRCLPQRDIKVIIATARPPRSVRHIYRRLGLDTLQINYNGALIWDEPRQKVIFHRPIEGSVVRQIIDSARRQYPETVITCEILDRWYTDRTEQPYTTETGRLFPPDVVTPLDQLCTQPITKLLLLGPKDSITDLEPRIIAAFGEQVSVVRAEGELLQIMEKRVSKSAALRLVAEHYGVRFTQVMAIGDAPNDVGMLQLAAVAVAMDNAHEIVKQTAHWIAPSNNDHGVHAALVRYGLCQ